MSFNETVLHLADGYVTEAIALLQRPAIDEDAVHDIRVLMKRLRGLLQLYGRTPCRDFARQMATVLRDVARTFAVQRDSHVLADTLRELVSRSSKPVAARLTKILHELEQQTEAAGTDLRPDCMATDLVWVRSLWHEKLSSQGEDVLLKALLRQYRLNRRQGREALKLRDETLLHDWRKRVKYLYYQLCALPHLQRDEGDGMEALRQLGSLLGKVHDLDVLAEFLRTAGHQDEAVAQHVKTRRKQLLKKIRRLYRRLFSHKVRQFRALVTNG